TGRVIIHQKPGDHYGENVVGACLNKAARLQALALENTASVCGATRKLVGKAFEFEDLGQQMLKGFERPEAVYRIRPRRRKGLSRFEALRGERRTPLVGRAEELKLLRKMMARASEGGGGAAAVLVGEPGIGKSRLVDALRRGEAQESVRYLSLQCSPIHQFSSLHPVKDYLDWVSGVNVDDTPETRRDKLRRLFQSAWQANEEQTAVLMDVVASSGPGQEANADIGILLKRRMAFQILSRKVFSTAMPGRPLFLVFEDVHWIDPTSAEFLEKLVRDAPEHAAVVLATTRPEGPFADRLHTLGQVVRLDRLRDAEAVELAKAAGRTAGLDGKALQAIVEKSDGVPLFLEEYALMLAESLGARQEAGATELRSIPLTLGGLVQNKLDRLNPHAQKVARIGAAVGRVFDLRLVRNLSQLGKDSFEKALDALQTADIAHRDAGIGSRRAASFKHALVQDAVYASLSTTERRRLHGTVADAMLSEEDGRRLASEVLAKHLLEAGRNAESAQWRLAAAMAAAGEGSAAEALAHITQGLAAIESLPQGAERDKVELGLRAIEGPTLMVTRGPGSPAFGAVQARALTLLRGQDNPDNLVPVIYNTALHAWACGRLADADATTDEIFDILEAEPSDGAFLAAHTMRGLVAWHRGDNAAALTHLSATVERYDPGLHREFYTRFLKEFGVFGRFYLGLTHTVTGETEAGARLARSALEIAKLVKRPHAYGFGLLAIFVTAILRGDVPTAARYSEESLEFAGRQGFPEFAAMSLVCQGWVKVRRGQAEAGIRQMEEGAGLWAMTGFENWQAFFATLLSDAYVAVGRLDDATVLLDRHDERVAHFGEAQFEPPLALSRAMLLSARGDPEGASRNLRVAQECARRHKAAIWVGG
ncbi:MAG: Adenylate cyclase, partial [Microvirga sp.]|nr:Adenylate cyclase [Microvirga sp.]